WDMVLHLRPVHVVGDAAHQNGGKVHPREARKDTVVQGFANARLDWWNEFPRNRSPDDFVDEEEAVLLVELPFSRGTANNLFRQSVQIIRGHFFHVLVAGARDGM